MSDTPSAPQPAQPAQQTFLQWLKSRKQSPVTSEAKPRHWLLIGVGATGVLISWMIVTFTVTYSGWWKLFALAAIAIGAPLIVYGVTRVWPKAGSAPQTEEVAEQLKQVAQRQQELTDQMARFINQLPGVAEEMSKHAGAVQHFTGQVAWLNETMSQFMPPQPSNRPPNPQQPSNGQQHLNQRQGVPAPDMMQTGQQPPVRTGMPYGQGPANAEQRQTQEGAHRRDRNHSRPNPGPRPPANTGANSNGNGGGR